MALALTSHTLLESQQWPYNTFRSLDAPPFPVSLESVPGNPRSTKNVFPGPFQLTGEHSCPTAAER
jgi:hypothetical protein